MPTGIELSVAAAAAVPTPLLATVGLGFVLGLKHALDADHLVAVTTIVGRQRSLLRCSMVGAWWGIGHTASLLAASLVVIAMRRAIPERAANAMEVGVGIMLIALGVDLLRRLLRGDLRAHVHEHDGHTHLHAHAGAAVTEDEVRGHHHVGKRPFLVGVVHGLAGTAALTLVVLSTIANVWAGLLYILVFGAGTIAGMLVMSALVGLPLVLAANLTARLSAQIQLVAAVSSVAFGIWYSVHHLLS